MTCSLPTAVTLESTLERLRIPISMIFYVGTTVTVETGHVSLSVKLLLSDKIVNARTQLDFVGGFFLKEKQA